MDNMAVAEVVPTTTKKKKIIVVGQPSEKIMERINQYVADNDIEIEFQEVGEDNRSFAYAEDFDPNPPAVTIPYSLTPYLEITKSMYDLPILTDYYPNPTSKQSKYARAATQAELDAQKVGRNEFCHCGSTLKFKKCHGK